MLKKPLTDKTHAICNIPLKTNNIDKTVTPAIETAPPAALIALKTTKLEETEEISTKGPNFCQDKSKYNLKRDKPTTTLGTQKCRGNNPIFTTTPTSNPKYITDPTSLNKPQSKTNNEPLDCATKYNMAPFLLIWRGIATGIKDSKFNSSPSHASGQLRFLATTRVPKNTPYNIGFNENKADRRIKS